MGNVLEIVLPVFLLVGLGHTLRRIGLADNHFFRQANGIVFSICLPLLLFYKISTADFTASFNIRLVLATGGAVVCCFLLAYGYGKWRGFPPPVHGAFCQGAFRGNLAYIGLAIIFNAYGDPGLARAGILLGFLVPILNFFAILALVLPHQGQRTDYVQVSREILVNPLIIASLLGIGWSFFHLPLPTVLLRFLHIATGMTLPLALLCIGGTFSWENIRGDLPRAAGASVIKLIILPGITAGLLHLLAVTGMDFAIGLLMAGAPAAVATYIMACRMGGDGVLAGSIVMMTTAGSTISYTLLLLALQVLGM